jgi:diaminohydroxyphosphoribosylaminopyrimidine deaminase/5-amino-6-(5-phosphoribosylamino)uracil reductase
MVGAVITEGGQVVAEGFHAKAGEPHAEVMALRALGRKPAADAVLHVTLEPCCTHGRTPPCVDAILAAGFRTVADLRGQGLSALMARPGVGEVTAAGAVSAERIAFRCRLDDSESKGGAESGGRK